MIIHLCIYFSNSVQEIFRSFQLCRRDEALLSSLNEYHLLVQNPPYTLPRSSGKGRHLTPGLVVPPLFSKICEWKFGTAVVQNSSRSPVPVLRENHFSKLVTDQVERRQSLDAPACKTSDRD